MIVEKNPINGAWYISDVIDSHLVSMQYFYCTRREAVAEFTAEFLQPTQEQTT